MSSSSISQQLPSSSSVMAPSGVFAISSTSVSVSPDAAAAATTLFRVNTTSSAPFRSTTNSNSMGSFQSDDVRMHQSFHAGGPQLKQRRMSMDSQLLFVKHDPLIGDNNMNHNTNDDGELDDDELEDEDDDDMDNNEVEARINRLARSDALKAQQQQQQTQQPVVLKPPSGEPIRKRNVGVPKFLRFLYQILESEDREIIAWSHKGTAFQIRQPDELADRVLPRYFKHNKVSSFQRQLNYFGFKKWTKTQTTICTFSHPFFLRGEKDKMKLIKRKERVAPLSGSAGGSSHNNSPGSHGDEGGREDDDDNEHGDQDVATNMISSATKSNSSSFNKRQRANSTVKPKGIGARELAMRRHSTGTLALSASLIPPGAVGAAAAALINRKRSGTIDLELELQAQKGMDLNKEPMLRLPSRAKRKSLPHVMLPPSLRDRKGNQIFNNQFFGNVDFGGVNEAKSFAASMAATGSSNPGGAGIPMGGGGYFGHRMPPESSSSMKQDASAVLPVSSEMMMQHVYLRQHSHPGAIGAGHSVPFQLTSMKNDNAMDMSDLSGPLQHATVSWAVQQPPPPVNSYHQHQQLKEPNMMMMNPFKYADPSHSNNANPSSFDTMPIMDYATNSAQLSNHALKMHNQQQQQQQLQQLQQQQHANFLAHQQQQQQQQQQEQQQNYYLDVLLESAALDDQLASTQPSEPQAPVISTTWDQHYLQQQQQQQQQQHVTPYSIMQQQQQQPHPMSNQHALQQQHQQMQLSAMNTDLNTSHAHRF